MAGADRQAKKASDLGIRTVSAIVMLAVAGAALSVGGLWWTGFAALVGLGVLWEWFGLVRKLPVGPTARGLWNAGGIFYIGLSVLTLVILRNNLFSIDTILVVLLAVIATDVGAYFAGRTIGGPKIAPAISPSKTWAGLGGGIAAASLVILLWLIQGQYELHRSIDLVILQGHEKLAFEVEWWPSIVQALAGGAFVAVVAQVGDFFESWMKRRAGVKDSGKLIPGHGGLFDRVDGLLAVTFVGALGLVFLTVFVGPGIR